MEMFFALNAKKKSRKKQNKNRKAMMLCGFPVILHQQPGLLPGVVLPLYVSIYGD